ncbi:MAG: hypothetical protein GY870_13900 [archaeon]|nr:hypothetical protein [archaeon]
MEYQTARKEESFGKFGYGLEIKIGSTVPVDLKNKRIQSAIYEASDKIKAEVCAVIKSNDPKIDYEIKENRKLLSSSLFKKPIFVEEIPNEYCSDWCCRHLPWFIITTTIGRFKIGWRKRVIEIDWSETVNTKDSEELFKSEDVTKGEKYIHAWNIDKASEYIEKITNQQQEE